MSILNILLLLYKKLARSKNKYKKIVQQNKLFVEWGSEVGSK